MVKVRHWASASVIVCRALGNGDIDHYYPVPALVDGALCKCGRYRWYASGPIPEPGTVTDNASVALLGSRDPVTTDYSQLSHIALRLMAETQAEGNKKYGYGNWHKGLPVSQLASHALAHILAIINGDTSENHLGHALWNLEKMAHFIETRPDLIDIEPLKKALEAKK